MLTGYLRRTSLASAIALALLIPAPVAHAWVAEAGMVIGAIGTLAGMFGPKGGGSTEILLAIANNIAAINKSLQQITQDVAELKKDVAALPDKVLQHEMAVQITGRLQETIQSLEVLSKSVKPAERESVYRDLRRYYDLARDLRSDLLSSEMVVAERLALQIPLLYGVELSSFNALNSIDLEDPNNAANYKYFVHEDQWRYALSRYAQFYRTSLDTEVLNSFANELEGTENEIGQIFEKFPQEYRDRLDGTDDVILATSFCYYHVSEERIATGRDCDDTGCSTEYDDFKFYSFYKQTYVFERTESGEISNVEEWSERLGDYDDLMGGSPIDNFKGDYGEECTILVPFDAFDEKAALSSDSVKRLEYLFAQRNLLRHLRKLGETMEEVILAEMKLRGMADEEDKRRGTLQYPAIFLGGPRR